MTEIRFWTRDLVPHAAAHILTRWADQQAVLMCGNWARRGGEVITWAEAEQLQLHVCVGCSRVFGGKRADVQTLYASHLGGSR